MGVRQEPSSTARKARSQLTAENVGAWLIGESNAQMERVVVADQVAAVCLLIALPVFLISRRKA